MSIAERFPWYKAKMAPVMFGAPWSTDGHVIGRDLPMPEASDNPPPNASHIEAQVRSTVDRPVYLEHVNGYAIANGDQVFASHLLGIIEAATTGVVWRLGEDGNYPMLAAYLGSDPVGFVLGMRTSAKDARERTDAGYPECPKCEGHGGPACQECDGDGETECNHCGHETDCEECDGSGRTEEDCDACGGSGKFKPKAA